MDFWTSINQAQSDDLAIDDVDVVGLRFFGQAGHAEYAASDGDDHAGTGVDDDVGDLEAEAVGGSV